MPETISPGACKDINQKNLLAYIASFATPHEKAIARSVLQHSKIGKYTLLEYHGIDSNPPIKPKDSNLHNMFAWGVLAPVGQEIVTVATMFSCNPQTGRVKRIHTGKTVVFKQRSNYLEIPRAKSGIGYSADLNRDDKPDYVSLYKLPEISTSSLHSQATPQKVLTVRSSDQKVIYPSNFYSQEPSLLNALDETNTIDLSAILSQGGDPSCGNSVGPVHTCKWCTTEAARAKNAWEKWYDACTSARKNANLARELNVPIIKQSIRVGSEAFVTGIACGASLAASPALIACIGVGGDTAINGVDLTSKYDKRDRYRATAASKRRLTDKLQEDELKPANKAYNTCRKKYENKDTTCRP